MTCATFHFDEKGEHTLREHAVRVTSATRYSKELGYGYVNHVLSLDEDLRDTLPGGCHVPAVDSFLVDVPDGIYKVSVTFGHPHVPSVTTVKCGTGKVLVWEKEVDAGHTEVESFTIRVDQPPFSIAFVGPAPHVSFLMLEPTDTPTIFLAGDSTVTDQVSGQYPCTGWGQVLPLFFHDGIAVSNHARSGRSSKSFIAEGRLENIWRQIRPGDYVLIQFGHNDQKTDERGTDPFTSYPEYLQVYLDGAKKAGAIPVLVTPVHRRHFDESGKLVDTHGPYLEAMRQVAEEEQVPLIDLAAKSKRFLAQLGAEASKRIFMWTAPGEYEHFPLGAQDDTHFHERGAIRIAGFVAEEIREKGIHDLSSYLRPGYVGVKQAKEGGK
ncbi:rhamnogalacturonan acetylesterase [Brevibacillus migulae]|uniref:rhamnogalacturonan acetylesterase n=1 Tax=Brevibacillus migulae TaxID=1644114 RepID=UPI00106DEB19|nr:rhamnogalacturonan acetylesterase [Brevibacillus migulae]